MGKLFTLLLVAAVVTWAIKRVLAARGVRITWPDRSVEAPVFRVSFRAGRLASVTGRIPRNVLMAFEDIAARAALDGDITLRGIADLEFSESIPLAARQPLRNALLTGM